MDAMRIRNAGAEGVFTAFTDGMKAAVYARKLDAAEASNDLLTAENNALKNELATLETEVARLKKENRYYRFSRSRAYEQALEAQVSSVAHRRERGWAVLVAIGMGVVIGLAVAFGIAWCSGV